MSNADIVQNSLEEFVTLKRLLQLIAIHAEIFRDLDQHRSLAYILPSAVKSIEHGRMIFVALAMRSCPVGRLVGES